MHPAARVQATERHLDAVADLHGRRVDIGQLALEATAAVEPESETIIQAALKRLMVGRTDVVISHRLSMVRDSDQILVIDDGRITERGKHDELMAYNGWYARMYRMQMGEDEQAA